MRQMERRGSGNALRLDASAAAGLVAEGRPARAGFPSPSSSLLTQPVSVTPGLASRLHQLMRRLRLMCDAIGKSRHVLKGGEGWRLVRATSPRPLLLGLLARALSVDSGLHEVIDTPRNTEDQHQKETTQSGGVRDLVRKQGRRDQEG